MRHGVILAGLASALVLAEATAHAASAGATANPRTDFTAYTRPQGRASVGPLKLELGLIDEIMIGTYVPPWFSFPVVGAPVPNGYIKLRSWWSSPLTLALRAGALYVSNGAVEELTGGEASGSLASLTAEVNASLLVHRRLTVSLGADLTRIEATGNEADSATSIEGAAVSDNLMTRLFVEWRLTRVFSLTFLLRYIAYQSPMETEARYEGEDLTLSSDLTASTSVPRRRFTAVPGVAFEWDDWELSVGVGYGAFPLPALGTATSRAWPVVDIAFAYRFNLYD
jgi:hypothetical protein